jgi:hypothetical protein
MQSDAQSLGGDVAERSLRRGSQGRSPAGVGRLGINQTENSDDDYTVRGLNRDSKHTRSQRKIKPMYPGQMNNQGSKNMLKVVQEDQNDSGPNQGYDNYNLQNKNNLMQLAPSGQASPSYNQLSGLQQRGGKASSRERSTKIIVQG